MTHPPSMIVTIDGPAGAGKSSVAVKLAERLGFQFLDTGAMYRTVALAAIRYGCSWNDPSSLTNLTRRLNIELENQQVFLDGDEVTADIRTSEVTAAVRYVADVPNIREHLVELQRRAAKKHNIVTEGRDQGTIVFPNAQCKFFLTASPEVRARRRWEQLQARGENVELNDVLTQQNERDRQDCQRAVGKLIAADDALNIETDSLTADEVVDRMEKIVRKNSQGSDS